MLTIIEADAIRFQIGDKVQYLYGEVAEEVAIKLDKFDKMQAVLEGLKQQASDAYDTINDFELGTKPPLDIEE